MPRDRLDPYCKCPDRVSMAGVVTYCPHCRADYWRERRSIAYQRLLVLVVCWLAAYGLARLLLDLLTN
jgi:hypothetical protein